MGQLARTDDGKKVAAHLVRPAVDVFHGDDAYLLVADLPGVVQADLEVKLEDKSLTIVGTRSQNVTGEEVFTEVLPAEFRRTFALPTDVDPAAITARLEAGVLSLTLPRDDRTKPRRIDVQ